MRRSANGQARPGADADSGERATRVENDEGLWEMRNEGAQQIATVDAALERLRNGTYGRGAKCHRGSLTIGSRWYPTRRCARNAPDPIVGRRVRSKGDSA
ncbi:hypothetical protein Kim5_PD00197 (plasmid) [Rhizobium sp. Kim5]|nr:hypothetical protein Kim5_PD00197 [Rhizobium sp. Kim5]